MTKQLSEWLRHFYFHGDRLHIEFMITHKNDQTDTEQTLCFISKIWKFAVQFLPLLRENDNATVTFVTRQ